jgi:hypothetical protein
MSSRRGSRLLALPALALCFASGVHAADSTAGAGRETPAVRRVDGRDDMIAVLRASGPHPSLGSQADLFGRFAGTWDCDYSFIAEDGSVRHGRGEVLFGWILDGRALQDIWIDYPEPGSSDERTIGTSVRFVDPKSGKWQVVFVAPAANAIRRLEGGAEGDRIVLRGQREDGAVARWSFNDIRPDSFVWRGEISRDGGKTWRLREEHHMRRRAAGG